MFKHRFPEDPPPPKTGLITKILKALGLKK